MKLLPAITVGPEISVLPSAITERDTLLARCKLLVRVNSPISQKTAVELGTLLRRLSSDAEKARQEVKRPVLDAQDLIDTAAKEYRKPILAEIERIEASLTAYVREERAKQAEEERKAREAAKAAQEKADREAREIQEAAAKAAARTSDPTKAQQEIDLGNLRAKAAVASVAAPAPIKPPPAAPSGLRTTERWTYRLADIPDAIWKLAHYDRSLVRIEVNLSAVRAKIDAGARDIPGLLIYEELKAGTTAR